TPEAEENCSIMACAQLANFLLHGNICNSVNYPHLELERETEHRLTFAHKNIPNVLGQLSSVLAEQKLNIQEMANRHRGGFAYTIVDVNLPPTEETLKSLFSISGMLQLRYLLA
ncbi:MAG: 3-phosphoglycerate dehydrogenase, partial [Spirochaetota bacterium]